MANSSDILKGVHKEYGLAIAAIGGEYVDAVRIPSGVFAFDLMSGGGFPMGRISIVYGQESSGKTNLVLKTLAEGQRQFPDKVAVFVDAENSLDPEWAISLGVDMNRVIVVYPEYAEQAVDIIESFLYAEDVFAVVLDSIAALTTQNEIDSDAGKMIVGGASLLTGKMIKKATVSLTRMRNGGHKPPAFIAINQIRMKIGVRYGDPETMPGGNAVKFCSSFTVRLYGKAVIDKKINPVLPAYKETSVIMKKWKVPILSQKGEYKMQMLPTAEHLPGHCEDWNTVSTYLKDLGYLGKASKGQGWVMFGKPYKTLTAAGEYLYGNANLLAEAKEQIIKDMLAKGLVFENKQNEQEEQDEQNEQDEQDEQDVQGGEGI